MENLMLYLLRVSIALAAFYLAYLLLFEKRKYFRFNRIYLAGSMLISYFIPLITFQVDAPPVPARLNIPVQPVQTSPETVIRFFWEIYSWEQIMAAVFIFGSFIFLIRLAAGHLRAMVLISRARGAHLNGVSCLVSDEDIHPFTYFRKIILPSDTLKSPYLNMILQHEQIHVEEQHTIDVCIAELLFLFQWFNPFAWLMKDAVKNNLEFLTDDCVIRHADRQSYQLAMVTLAGKSGVPPFLTALNGSQLKNRIIMMKTKHKNNGMVRKFLLLPLLTLLVITLSNREFRAEAYSPETKTISGRVTSKETGKPIAMVAVLVEGKQVGTITDREGNYLIKLEDHDATLVYQLPGYQVEEVAVGTQSRIDVQLNKAPGTTHVEVVGYGAKPKVIHQDSVKVKTDVRVVVDNRVKTKVEIRELPKDSVNVKVDIRQSPVIITHTGKDTINPLLIIDGVRMKKGMTNKLMPPAESIESISVLKDESGTSIYGKEGENGVIIITTKKKK
ncbi:MAG: carboxypeptidase-like regulatory domain-containing protein [Prolixibacteraceae bacterium]